jgi:uncharacterized Zn-binding protein involved in type VI secretion
MPPAARISDMHVCPMVTPAVVPIPHVGGPILPPCEVTVLVGALPAARFTDKATCTGPIDAIAKGSSGVIIGKLLAARMGDITFHGGSIILGEFTVLIGEAMGNVTMVQRGNIYIIVDRDNHRIYMVGMQEFAGPGATQAYVDSATAQINAAWSGATTFEGNAYTVVAMITGRARPATDAPNPTTNAINVVHTTDPPSVTSQKDPSNQYLYGKGPGHQHDTDTQGGVLTPSHEFGHAMGLPDEYKEQGKNPDGTRKIVRTGPQGGLMGYIEPGSKPTPGNYNSLVTGNGLAP